MIAVVTRVLEASVTVEGQIVGRIGPGLLVLAAVHAGDTPADLQWMANKLATLRIFRNGDKHFDQDVREVRGAILLVSNFTVAAGTRKGRRPTLEAAASPTDAEATFNDLVAAVRALGIPTETGRFGADMKVASVNDGPVTFIVNSHETRR